jgi:hypothetical protein
MGEYTGIDVDIDQSVQRDSPKEFFGPSEKTE